MEKRSSSNLGAVSSSLYVSFQVIANMLSTKIALLPFLNWSVDGGTIIYPLTFTLRDFVHKTLGKVKSRQIVILAAVINLVMALLFILVGKMRPDPSWQYQEAYEKILLPVWRITMGSIIAQVISELVDTEVFSFVYHRFADVLAVLASNTVALVVDSVVFTFVAFYGQLPTPVLWQILATNIIIKLVMSLISSPAIKLVPRQVEINQI